MDNEKADEILQALKEISRKQASLDKRMLDLGCKMADQDTKLDKIKTFILKVLERVRF